ncbi:structural maintenance of chromosomes flexible hinge domain-containing protein 1 [Folsomia candida]|uniref:Structural maintenance of chromosomes flexible hinge domain-containing protein 1 n=1 Tax=Folsomia candida TaxID=158441 RepID=A0A226DBA6_FOLCA|nr:structural maintenance of chromosomes flexible hinge domain-containing protein 1 [Folsomia candida]OXA41921.1 Structural maintenance of chromosomes flexible hinge domain-containing protein 1 [Folsomia candida]
MASQSTQGPGDVRQVDIIVTDLRDSVYQGRQDRTQIDIELSGVHIKNADLAVSLANIRRSLGSKLSARGSNPFKICNTDKQPIESMKVQGLLSLRNLILLDEGQTTFPIVYKQSCSIVPHIKVVTSQEGKFYGLEEHNRAAFALAELVDNSLSATANNSGRRIIEILFYENGPNSSVVVLDNGCGMSSDELRTSLKHKAPKETRLVDESPLGSQQDTTDPNEATYPMYLTSKLNKFGAGMKNAIFSLGGDTTIMTKRAESESVCEVSFSKSILEQKESQNQDPWKADILTGKVAKLRSNTTSGIIKQIVKKEARKSSFTHIVIQNLMRDGEESFLHFLQRIKPSDTSGTNHPTTIEEQLAHIYHYYVHGPAGNAEPEEEIPSKSMIDIIVSRFNGKGTKTSSTNLRDVCSDLESRFVRTASTDTSPYRFTIQSPRAHKVTGIIRYHPFEYDHETLPSIHNRVADTSREDISGQKLFSLWWNGRLIPQTFLPAANWCSPADGMKHSDKLYKSYGRISGSLFLHGDNCEINDNKLNLVTTSGLKDLLTESKSISSRDIIFQEISVEIEPPNHFRAKRISSGIKTSFEKWLTKSRECDREVKYSTLINDQKITLPDTGPELYYQYKVAEWEGVRLTAGNTVKMSKPNSSSINSFGKIKSFYVHYRSCHWFEKDDDYKDEPQPSVFAPISYFGIERLPAAFYVHEGQSPIEVESMALIDKSVAPSVAAQQIEAKSNELQLDLKIVDFVHKLEDNFEISANDHIFDPVRFDVVKKSDGTSVKGFFPFHKPKGKRIILISMIHKLDAQRKRHLVYEGKEVCQYMGKLKPSGYHFKELDTKHGKCDQIGKYILSFRSYIVISTGSSPKHGTTSTGGLQRAATPRLPAADSPYEIEWDQPVDSRGRKILNVDGAQIRMPYLEFNFSVVAGPPAEFKMDELSTQHLTIGVRFKISFTCTDASGNSVTGESLEVAAALLVEPKITFLIKNHVDSQLSFTFGELCVDGDKLVINDVVTMGHLNNKECKYGKLQVEFTMNSDNAKSCSRKVSVYPGIPVRIESLQQSVQVENGSKPSLICRVVDCGGNVVYVDKDKPILLDCVISKINGEPVLKSKFLATQDHPQKLEGGICLPELRNSSAGSQIALNCQIMYSTLDPVTVTLQMIPSTGPQVIRIYLTRKHNSVEEQTMEIYDESSQEVNIGEELTFSYKILDGTGKEIKFNPTLYKIKASWAKNLVTDEHMLKYKVPNQLIHGKEFVTKLSLLGDKYGEIISHSFSLTSLPGEPASLRVRVVGARPREVINVPMGNKLPDLIGNITDGNGNMISVLDKDQLERDLDISVNELKVIPEIVCLNNTEGSFVIRNADIQPNQNAPRKLGNIDLTVIYKEEFSSTIQLNIVPGPPVGLVFILNGQQQDQRGIFSTPNGSQITTCARLVDRFGNFTRTETPITVKLNCLPTTDWVDQGRTPNTFIISEDNDGRADFHTITAQVKPGIKPKLDGSCKLKDCTGNCYGGPLSLKVEADFDGKQISDICKLHLTCRSDIPSKLIPEDAGSQGSFTYQSGSNFDHLTVPLQSEDGSMYKQAEINALTLSLTPLGENNPAPHEIIDIQADKVREGIYTFGQVPTKAGVYTTNLIYRFGSTQITEIFKPLHVTPGPCHALLPHPMPTNLSASNHPENCENRVICYNLKLVVRDQYSNPIWTDEDNHTVEGYVRMEFRGALQLEHLENHVNLASGLPIKNGCVLIQKLSLLPNLALPNGSQQTIHFIARMIDESEFVFPLEFTFYNSAQELQACRKLANDISALDKLIGSNEGRVQDLCRQINAIDQKIKPLRDAKRTWVDQLKLHAPTRYVAALTTSKDIIHLVANDARKEKDLESKRKKCNVPAGPADGQPGVLGTIGLLAEIKPQTQDEYTPEDANIQRVLSWHLQNKLTVTVTETAAKGHELEERYKDDPFMLLDIIKDHPPWDNNLHGEGNPIYAHRLLQFTNPSPKAQELTKKVFNKVLGDTIIIDNIESATKYMGLRNASGAPACPTILTRDGRRLYGDGIIGGKSTRAPPQNRYMFGLAPTSELVQIRERLKILPSLKKAMEGLENAERVDGPENAALREDVDKLRTEINKLEMQRAELKKKLNHLTDQSSKGLPTQQGPTPASSPVTRSSPKNSSARNGQPKAKRGRYK